MIILSNHFFLFFLVILNHGVYTMFFYKIISIDEKYFNSYKNLLSVKWRNNCKLYPSLLVKCVVIRINNVRNWRDRWDITVLNTWCMWTYIVQARILLCILVCVWLICYVSVFLIVYCWTLIIFKWFITYDNGFCLVW